MFEGVSISYNRVFLAFRNPMWYNMWFNFYYFVWYKNDPYYIAYVYNNNACIL
jgi:hypothetical protein